MAKHDKMIFSYDKKNDILVIHKGYPADEQFKGNIEAGDIILDVSSNKRIRGIEMMNAKSFLKINFNNVEDADFSAIIKPNAITINILFKLKDKTELPVAVAVPLEIPRIRRKNSVF